MQNAKKRVDLRSHYMSITIPANLPDANAGFEKTATEVSADEDSVEGVPAQEETAADVSTEGRYHIYLHVAQRHAEGQIPDEDLADEVPAVLRSAKGSSADKGDI